MPSMRAMIICFWRSSLYWSAVLVRASPSFSCISCCCCCRCCAAASASLHQQGQQGHAKLIHRQCWLQCGVGVGLWVERAWDALWHRPQATATYTTC